VPVVATSARRNLEEMCQAWVQRILTGIDAYEGLVKDFAVQPIEILRYIPSLQKLPRARVVTKFSNGSGW